MARFRAAVLSKRLCAVLLPLALLGAAPAPKPEVGKPAPNAELTLMDGTRIELDELRGKVVVLNFWATWCAPCRKELPLLDAYYRIQKPAGLRVIAITTEDSLPLSRLRPLFARLEIESARRIKGPYNVLGGVPTSYVIDRSGKLRYAKSAAFTLQSLNALLLPLLKEKPPRPD